MAEGAFQKPTLAYKSASLTDVSLSGATLNVVTTRQQPQRRRDCRWRTSTTG